MTTQEILEAARSAKSALALADNTARNAALLGMADALCDAQNQSAILAANAEDMAAAKGHISDVMLDRLALTVPRIEAMAQGIREVAALPDPVGRVLNRVARRISGSLFPHKRELQQPEKYRYLQNKIRSFSITT